MWKKLLYSRHRRINSTSFISSISNLSSQFFSSSSSRFIGGIGVKSLPSDKILFSSTPTPIFGAKYVSFWNLNDYYLLCSESNSIENSHRCWNCDAEAANTTPFLFCEACCSVQPVNNSIDYFQIFGLRRNFNIEMEELDRKYKDWQKKLHPDLVHSKSQRERDYASEQSARVTDAFRTLADSLSRAIYIMKLEGVIVDEEERVTDLDLLAEIMELREAVEEAEGCEALIEIQAQLQEKLQHWYGSFEDAFRLKQYDDAISSIRRMTYYKRANEEIVKKL